MFFIPPKDWEIAHPEMLAPSVEICFLSKNSRGLAPSVNLAKERVGVSLERYVEAVRKIHATDPNSRWRDLGVYKTSLGEGRLTELETKTEVGTVRMMQLIVMKEGAAYILTTSALKEEFSKFYKVFDQTLRSLQYSSDLIESYPQKRDELRQLVQTATSWSSFEEKIITDFTEMGPYWQILFLKDMRSKLLPPRNE